MDTWSQLSEWEWLVSLEFHRVHDAGVQVEKSLQHKNKQTNN